MQARVRPASVVEVHVANDPTAGVAPALVAAQVDLLVLERAPEALDDLSPGRGFTGFLADIARDRIHALAGA